MEWGALEWEGLLLLGAVYLLIIICCTAADFDRQRRRSK